MSVIYFPYNFTVSESLILKSSSVLEFSMYVGCTHHQHSCDMSFQKDVNEAEN